MDNSAAPTQPSLVSQLWQPALMALAGLLLLAQCWKAPFLTYDDPAHIFDVPQIYGKAPLLELFNTPSDTYRPITFISYRIDYVLFGPRSDSTASASDENWAPAVRLMTCLYHVCAAIVLWRLLLLIGASAGQALFIALVFAAHPMACETVCWVSERKNALAGLFGFASLFAYLRWEKTLLRVPITSVLYTLALFSKPTALGLLPLFPILELCGGAPGLRGEKPLSLRPNPAWTRAGLSLIPLVAVALFALRMNLIGHEATIIAPPGGSVFTALLTDTEILARYIGSMVAPVSLSIAYAVEPIVSLLSVRLLLYSLLLVAVVGGTIKLAHNRRRAVFGWLWFFIALVPCLNLISIFYPMQDRYVYLSMPGFFLALTESVLGISDRFPDLSPKMLRLAGALSIVAFSAIGVTRSAAFQSTQTLFEDAAAKQPDAAWSHYPLTQAYAQTWVDTKDSKWLDKVQQQRELFLSCPDATRHTVYTVVALQAGEFAAEHGDLPKAEGFFKLSAFPAPGVRVTAQTQSAALRDLAQLHLAVGKPSNAFKLAQEALKAGDAQDKSLLVRALAAVAWAKTETGDTKSRLLAGAKNDLQAITAESEAFQKAQAVLKDEVFEH